MLASIVVVLPETSDTCMIIKPRTLKVKARFRTARERESFNKVSSIFFQAKELNRKNELQRMYLPKVRNVVASAPGVPGISTSLKKAIKWGNKDRVTSAVSRKVYNCIVQKTTK